MFLHKRSYTINLSKTIVKIDEIIDVAKCYKGLKQFSTQGFLNNISLDSFTLLQEVYGYPMGEG